MLGHLSSIFTLSSCKMHMQTQPCYVDYDAKGMHSEYAQGYVQTAAHMLASEYNTMHRRCAKAKQRAGALGFALP